MSEKKKTEEVEEEHVSFGVGDEQALGFQQSPDGHGWSDEELAARETARQKEIELAVREGVIEAPAAEEKPKSKPVAMDTGVQSAGGSS